MCALMEAHHECVCVCVKRKQCMCKYECKFALMEDF